ncbi:torsin-1A-like [Leptinotarsa decemlineata]|uniref:torsin-1A-like n=1 Tax=Leptinotarsa decemlineata TaxID=7539 RepID=UPI003D30B56C
MDKSIFKHLTLLLLIHYGNCENSNSYCFFGFGKCAVVEPEKESYFFEKYLPISFPFHSLWKFEKQKQNSWNPYCWIKDCYETDNFLSSFNIFKPHCWFLDCNEKKDKQQRKFSFLSYIPWINEREVDSERDTKSSDTWSLNSFNPMCWIGKCSKIMKDKESNLLDVNEFMIAAKSFINHQPAISQLKLLQYYPSCWLGECCNDYYITGNIKKLSSLMEEHLYGQHLANDIIVAAIRSHWTKRFKPKKALALSFHGWVGSGKNYVAGMIAESLFKLGRNSRYVHYFPARVLFTLNSKVDEYRENLYQWLRSNITLCPRQLFIFDEVEMMPEQILNAIKPMLDYKSSIDGADYTEAIFLFISNTGSDLILRRYEELIGVENKKREEIDLRDFKNLILEGVFSEKGGFHHSDTISNNLIDHYIPFLPMEKKHVLECIKDEFLMRNIAFPLESHMEYILENVRWDLGENKQFSKTGCKLISFQVALIIEKYYKEEQDKEL